MYCTTLSFFIILNILKPHAGSRIVRIDPLHFLAGYSTRQLNQALSVLSLSLGLVYVLYCVVLFCVLCVLSLGCSC